MSSEPNPADIPPPLAAALAERYRLERELGAGGMARVYLAEDLKHHRKVAVKVRIDYPVWSPDGKWILFDRAAPSGGDIWLLEGTQ